MTPTPLENHDTKPTKNTQPVPEKERQTEWEPPQTPQTPDYVVTGGKKKNSAADDGYETYNPNQSTNRRPQESTKVEPTHEDSDSDRPLSLPQS